jgi:predicted secreted protein
MGMGLGWLTAPALAVETASLELTNPEGLALGAYITTIGTVAATLIVPVFYGLQKECGWSVDAWVRIALFLQAASLCLASAAAHSTIIGLSWALYTAAFLGSIAANLQRLAAMPWVINGFPSSPSCVSWLLAGGNLSSLACALLGVIQQPGEQQRIGVGIYFATLLCIVAASTAAYCLLRTRRALPARVATKPPTTSAEHVVPRHNGGEAVTPTPGAAGWLPPFARHPEVVLCVATNATVQYICWIVLGFLLPFAAARAAGATCVPPSAIGTTDVAPGTALSMSGGTLLGYTVSTVFPGCGCWLTRRVLFPSLPLLTLPSPPVGIERLSSL